MRKINNNMNEMRRLINLIESAQVQEEPMGKLGKAAATGLAVGSMATAGDVEAQPEISDQPGKIATPLTIDQQDTVKLKNNAIKFTKKFMASLKPKMPSGLVPGDWKGVDYNSIEIAYSSLDDDPGQIGRAELEKNYFNYIVLNVEYKEIVVATRPARKYGRVEIRMEDRKDPFKITSIKFDGQSDAIFKNLPGIKDFVYDKPGQPGIGFNLMTGRK